MNRPKLRRHPFSSSGKKDFYGVEICICGSLQTAAMHRYPDIDEQVAEHERRRIGEK